MSLKSPFKVLAGVALALLLWNSVSHALPGDLNGSGRVDGHDLVSFGRSNGSVGGNANWNPDADLNQDGKVDGEDLDILSIHFGKNGVSFALWAGTLDSANPVCKLSGNGARVQSVGGFSNPAGLAPDADGKAVWVADDALSELVKLNNRDGSRLAVISGVMPRSVSVNHLDGAVWVADTGHNRVLKLQPGIADGYDAGSDTGSHIVIMGFNQPGSVSVDPVNGSVWVADTGNNRIVRLDTNIADGYNVDSDAGSHREITGFSTPKSVSVNISDGSVWVADTGNNQIVKISPTSFTELLRKGGYNAPAQVRVNPMDGSAWVADELNGRVIRLGPDGSVLAVYEGLDHPVAVDVNPSDGSCWTHDSGDVDEIVHLSPGGFEILRIGPFDDVRCLAVIPDEVLAGRHPMAAAQVNPAMAYVNDEVTLTGTGIDPDGEIIKYEWDVNGDGVFEFSNAHTGTTTATYPVPGIYTPVFRVTDNEYLTATDYSRVLRVDALSAGASADPTQGSAPLTVDFSGSFSDPIDGKVYAYQWDFDGDGNIDHSSNLNGNIQHVYPSAGTYHAAFSVTDGTETAADTVIITVSQSPPVASADAAPRSGNAPLTVAFTGSGTDADGNIAIYAWDFDVDGEENFSSGSTGNTSFTYNTPGTYTPVFRITDNDGLSDEISFEINVGSVTVTAAATPNQGIAPLTVSLSAGVAGLVPGNSIVSYAWDFDGDGLFDQSGPVTPVNHTYPAGTWTSVLRVTDTLGNHAESSVKVTVEKNSPTAYNYASPSGNMPLTVFLSGAASDADGSIILYEWDYDGDGAFDWFSETSGQTYFKYPAPGTYITCFRATDNDGLTAVATKTIIISDSQLAPTATAAADATKGYAPLRVNFTGTGLDPDDGSIILYEWDFDGDGTYDDSSADSGSASHDYAAAGTYNAILRVTDVDGLTDTDSLPVTVKAAGAPTAVANADPISGDIPLTVSFDAQGSSDPGGGIVLYEWNFGSPLVWVADQGNDRINRYDGHTLDKTLSGFNGPHWVSLDPNDGCPWVTDTSNNEVVKLAADGSKEIYRVPGFNGPLGIAVTASDGSVWVADTGNNQVVKLSSGGTELVRVSGFYNPAWASVDPSDGSVWVAGHENEQVVKLSSGGTELVRVSGFYNPAWASVDPSDGSVWVADYENDRVVKLSPDTPDGYDTGQTYTPDSGPFNHLSRINEDIAGSAGRLSGAFVFDGYYDYVQVSSDPSLDVQSFTVEAWIKPDAVGGSIFMRGNSAGENELLFRIKDNNVLSGYINNSAAVDFDGADDFDFTDGNFHHVALTYNSATQELIAYVDGSQFGNASVVDADLDFDGSDALIGADFDGFNKNPGSFFDGIIDDVRFWNVVRSQPEINAAKEAELTGTEPGLVGYWKCNVLDAGMYHKSLDGFNRPRHISVNAPDQSVWITEEWGARVTRVAKDCDRIISRIDGFSRPYSTYIPPGGQTVWVVDHLADQVVVMSFDGTVLHRITGLSQPTGIAGVMPAGGSFSSSENGDKDHTYFLAGEYEATLRVTDGDGNSDTDSVLIRAGVFPEAMPTADPATGQVPLTVNFNANGNSPAGAITSFRWDFGDGMPEWTSQVPGSVDHAYTIAGVYTATLTVMDDRGISGSASVVITVLPPPDDGAPQAFAAAHPIDGNAPLEVTLEGFGADTDGFIRKFEWDYTSDGIYDFTSPTTGITTHTYAEPGSHTATLRVTDDTGKTGTDTVVIQVRTAD